MDFRLRGPVGRIVERAAAERGGLWDLLEAELWDLGSVGRE